jgi:very-short-patch-repair endonuclease
MKIFLAILIILVAAAIIASVLLSSRPKAPAYRKRAVLTPNEVEFHGRLARALAGLHVCPQVAMHALIEPTALNSQTRLRDFRRVSQKIVDFAVFDAQWAIVLVIELDDRTHVASRDAVRDSYMSAAGIRTLRYQSRAKPSEAQIAADVWAVQQAAAIVAAGALAVA